MSFSDFRKTRRPISIGVALYDLEAEPWFLVQLDSGLWTDGLYAGPISAAERWLYERASFHAETGGDLIEGAGA